MARFATHVRVVVDGELDIETAPALENALSRLQRAGADVLLDLTALSWLDSAGLRVLWAATGEAAAGGTSLVMMPPVGEARRLLSLAGMESRLSLVG